jgi:hypothetical protein
MAAFVDFVRARLTPGVRGRSQAASGSVRVPAAGEPFGRPAALRLHWQVDRAGGLAANWEPAGTGARLIPPA